MSETRLTLAPIDLSTIPELGLAEQEELTRAIDQALINTAHLTARGYLTAFLSTIGLLVSLTGGTGSLVGVLGLMALFAVSAAGAVHSVLTLWFAHDESQKFDELSKGLLTHDQERPLASIELQLHAAVTAWNEAAAALNEDLGSWEDTVGSWEVGNQVTTLQSLVRHREAIEREATFLLERKQELLEAIEQLKPYDKLLTPIE